MREGVRRAVLDTNVLIYDLIEDSLYHGEASSILDSLEEWIIPTIVVHELLWFTRGLGLGARECREIILQYINSERAVVKPILPHHIRRALDMISGEGLSPTRYNDKLILITALEEKAPIATFDKKLRSQARKHGINTIPRELTTKTP